MRERIARWVCWLLDVELFTSAEIHEMNAEVREQIADEMLRTARHIARAMVRSGSMN